MTTIVYHYHRETHVYLGATEAIESPLEPGVFLCPAHATLTSPAEIDESQVNVWDHTNSVWTQQERPEPPQAAPPQAELINSTLPPIPEELPNAITQLRVLRNQRLRDVDWVAIKYFSLGAPYPTEWTTYVQALRDLPAISDELVVDDEGRLVEASVAWPTWPTPPAEAIKLPPPPAEAIKLTDDVLS